MIPNLVCPVMPEPTVFIGNIEKGQGTSGVLFEGFCIHLKVEIPQ
jgi:hypothetical protein